ALVHGEGKIGLTILGDVLNDHIDFDVGIGHRTQDASSDAGGVGHAEHGDLGFAAVESPWFTVKEKSVLPSLEMF
ncbi:hypothetical protein, partial [Enterobacter hormaechei]|uniref:hypothetical protein n=1 Tax=Enterobacter hormaechei TaxID=158836 RepID=UPI0023E8215F